MPKICNVEGCEKSVKAKGLCSKHYYRLSKYGDVEYVKVVQTGMKKKFPQEYRILSAIRNRCYNKRSEVYPRYGGRGIKVCKRWLGPRGIFNFLEDMGPRPGKEYTIDRIDNDKGYSPGNCRWATWTEQENNRRSNVLYEYKGKKMTLPQWARELGIGYGTLCYRKYKNRMSPPELFAPVDARYSHKKHYVEASSTLE